MYFVFIYDSKYMKSDRDFFGDAIISFYPNEEKESYLFLLGQLIGAIDFLKALMPTSTVEQFSLDKLLLCLRPLNQQFLMVIASDEMTLSNELFLEKKLTILFNLVRMIYGPVSIKDRTDEEDYNNFKNRINEITVNCCESLNISKNITFDSHYSFVSKNFQDKVKSRCNFLMGYLKRNLNSFASLLFYNDRILSTGIKTNMIINLLYFLANEQTNLIKHCESIFDSSNAPSKFHLVKVHVPKSWLSNLVEDAADSREYLDVNSLEKEDAKYSDDDLVMDVLPKSTRFQTKVSLNSFADNSDYFTNDFYDESIEQEIALYIQRNSKINLISMCLDTFSDKYREEFILNLWPKLMSNFSEIESELIDEESNINDNELKNSNKKNNNLIYSCVIDRNQMIKNSLSKKSNPVKQSNMNLYHELFKAMPELSEMNISRNSKIYSYSKQTMATISSSTLQEFDLNESISTNKKVTKDKKDFELIDANITTNSSILANLNYGDVLIKCNQIKIE